MEDKKEILKAFEAALRLTRAGSDIESLALDEEREVVTISLKSGTRTPVSVWGDSGAAMMRDIIKAVL